MNVNTSEITVSVSRLRSSACHHQASVVADLTLLPPPKTPDDDLEAGRDLEAVSEVAAPDSFTDRAAGKLTSLTSLTSHVSLESLPSDIVDLPTPIRDRIDALVQNDEDLGSQLAAIDALMFGQ